MKRMFGKNKREKKEPMEIDITSLLDVLVILLVFLLKNYNASDLKLDLMKNLEVPLSDARKLGHHAIIIQVDKTKQIFVNKEKIGFAIRSGEIPKLKSKLLEFKANSKEIAKKKPKKINLVFDKSLPYKTVQSIMHTSALAGYTEFKFIVQGNY